MDEEVETTIVIADDHPLFRGAMRQVVGSLLRACKVIEAGSFDELTAALERERDLDLVLLDLTMPGIQGFSGLLYLRAQFPQVPVVVVSAHENAAVIRRVLEFGASGFIPKSLTIDQIGSALTSILSGGTWSPPDIDLSTPDDQEVAELLRGLALLTPQQLRVLMMLSEGLLNKQIAYELGVSEATVKAHVSAILQKLRVDSRTQAVIAASKIGAVLKPVTVVE
jgi:DNA-binding NarL/FixJ family response regulator